MKKVIILLGVILCLSLVGCGSSNQLGASSLDEAIESFKNIYVSHDVEAAKKISYEYYITHEILKKDVTSDYEWWQYLGLDSGSSDSIELNRIGWCLGLVDNQLLDSQLAELNRTKEEYCKKELSVNHLHDLEEETQKYSGASVSIQAATSYSTEVIYGVMFVKINDRWFACCERDWFGYFD